MSMRGSFNDRDQEDNLDELAALQQQDDMEDDNAQPDLPEAAEEIEDPLMLAVDDLEGRLVGALDDLKLHPGVRSSSAPGAPSLHDELAIQLRPVLEVAAHTGPSVARTYYRGVGSEGLEASIEEVYGECIISSDLLEEVEGKRWISSRGASRF